MPATGVEIVAIRPAPVYGPGDTRLVKLYQLAGRKRVILLGDGRPRYHMIYIDDLVAAFRLAAETPGVSGEAFIIAGDEMPTLEEVIRQIGQSQRPRGPDAGEGSGRAGAAGGRPVRVDLPPVRHQSADLSPADRVLRQQSRLRHHQGPHPAGLRARRQPAATASPARSPGTGSRGWWRAEGRPDGRGGRLLPLLRAMPTAWCG